jgi:predicted deacylase
LASPPTALRALLVFRSPLSHGGENFVIQAGSAGGLQQDHCERVFRALVAFLSRTGVIDGVELAAEDELVHHFDLRQTFPVFSDHAGLFVPRVAVGIWLLAGAVIGDVYDAFDGEPRAEIRAPLGGLLSGIRRQPLLFQGDLVARIQTRSRSQPRPTQDEQ